MHELESLKSIFKDRIFKIPDYQRGYAWTTKQLTDFWEDLINLPVDRYHYTGLLSLKKVDKNIWQNWNDERWLIEDRAFNPFYIVDGQQRLTTFVIFVQAIYEHIKSMSSNQDKTDAEIYLGTFSLKAIKEEYLLIEQPPKFIIKTHKFGYESDNPSFKFLKHKIFLEPDSGTLQETFYTLNLENAKRFFKENLQNYLSQFNGDDGLAEIELLFKKLTQNLMFNVYEISDDFDVFVAFETMNNRGKKLSNLELLKNRLIYLTTLYDDKQLGADERVALREKINNTWREIYHQLGKNKQRPLNDDDFLLAHWIIYFHYTRKKGNDYIRFLLDQKFTTKNIYEKTEIKINSLQEINEIRDDEFFDEEEYEINNHEEMVSYSKLTPQEIDNYVGNLKSAVCHWYNTHNPVNNEQLTSEESLWIDRLNRIGMMYFRPLVVASFLNTDISSEERVSLFKAIERFIFIAFRLCRSMSNYKNSEFYKMTKMLCFKEISIDKVIDRLNELINKEFSDANGNQVYLKEIYFKTFLEKKFKNNEGYYRWNGLTYFLYEYEMEKYGQSGNQKIDWDIFTKSESDKVSIEHIYPMTATHQDWQNEFKEYDDKQKSYFKGTLGNLLPLSLSINSSLQNDCFDDKKHSKYNEARRGYDNGSHCEIEVASYDKWGSEEIFDRGIKMLSFMEKRWNFQFASDKVKAELLFLDFMLPKTPL